MHGPWELLDSRRSRANACARAALETTMARAIAIEATARVAVAWAVTVRAEVMAAEVTRQRGRR